MRIARLAGDGIGPEIVSAGSRVLDAAAKLYGHEIEYTDALVGGAAWDEYREHLPRGTLDVCEGAQAIYFGAVGGPLDERDNPKWDGAERNSLLGLRFHFDLYGNLRPVIMYPCMADASPLKKEVVGDELDILVVRENIGGIYFSNQKVREIVLIDGTRIKPGMGKFLKDERYGLDVAMYTESEVRRNAKMAFEAARGRRMKRVHSVHKANVINAAGKIWRDVYREVAPEYPDVEFDELYVDNTAMQIASNPRQFDVIGTGNCFGDILSDEGGTITGSLGMLPTLNIGGGREGEETVYSMAEPAHGSAPKIAGTGKANPLAQIMCGAMMFRHSFGWIEEAELIERAVEKTLEQGYRTPDIAKLETPNSKIVGTTEMADRVIVNMHKIKEAA